MAGKAKHRPAPQSVPSRKQRPTPDAPPATKQKPRCLAGIDGGSGSSHPMWRTSFLDLEHNGLWSWEVESATLRKIIAFLREMERLTWAEVRAQLTGGRRRGPKHKFIPADHLCPEAQRRLTEIKLDEFDELFRFRLGNMERLWGAVYDDVFYPVWWDPAHRVCPSGDPD